MAGGGRRRGSPPETRKPRGSLGRSLDPLGTLAHSVSGRGPNSEWSSCRWPRPPAGCDPKIAPSRLRDGSASRETRHPGTARRSRRIPVRSSESPRCPRSPDGSGSRSTASKRLSPLRASWLGPPPGFPFGVAGKVDPPPSRWQLHTLIVFREGWWTARGPARSGPCPLSGLRKPTDSGLVADRSPCPDKEW